MSLPLLLVPGMMCDARLFGPQIAALSADRQVTVPGIDGHDTMDALAAEILEDAPPRFCLAGLSMGGIVAMEMLRQAPDRIAGLALLDTNPLAEADRVKARRAGQMDRVAAGGLRAVMRDEMKPLYLADGPDRNDILALCMDMAEALGPEVFLRQSRALRDRIDQTETLALYRGPALVLCGRHDALCPVHRHELMHSLMPQSHLQVIEEAGHLPTLECPDKTTAALSHWLAETG
ncbi:alpha/beta fold hydrolase [Alphaproteobacteria bacterium GH1-50]|uniref:Alpha/beta fold hydrolase n=1 Tax=Kangsaoukella pontilimi TaxID=2691042 RepID=A0A7C9MW34_9RHOB|nr:alpha/beta hydrolase [Kangsaoukella pontilimi]MXQ08100.1 alpha/beta fold hydrolase [Kangsaoukella pontilimi]